MSNERKKTEEELRIEEEEKGYYFKNSKVDRILVTYVKGGCVDVFLRDEIMSHAEELIRQIIRTHNFYNIYPGHDPSSFGDLFQVAWGQIEKTLYKFNMNPGRTKVFNMWSQIAKTVILAHIKKETRDKKNYDNYKSHLQYKPMSNGITINRFFEEATEMFKNDKNNMKILSALYELYREDDRTHEGLVGKLSTKSGYSRAKIQKFLSQFRLRAFDFSDSPTNQKIKRRLPSTTGSDDVADEE